MHEIHDESKVCFNREFSTVVNKKIEGILEGLVTLVPLNLNNKCASTNHNYHILLQVINLSKRIFEN